jgi:PBSX family phage terminase large subunit
MTSAEKSIIPEFTDKMEREGDHKYFDVTAKEIVNKVSDSRILFSGIKTSSGNQTANLKGIEGLTTFVVDEGEEWVRDEEFDKIRLSIRQQGVRNRTIIIMNPSDIEHFIYKRFIEKTHKVVDIDGVKVEISTHPDVCHIHTTYLNNLEHLHPDWLKEVERIKNEEPEKYANIIIGAWARQTEGVILPKNELRYFNPNEPREFETSNAYADIADEGMDSTSVIFGRNIGKDVYITDVVHSKLTSEYTIPEILRKAKEQQLKYIRVESNSMGAMYGRNLTKESQGTFSVLPARSTTNKHTRIINDAYFIKRNFVFIAPEHQSEEYRAFMNELVMYNKDPKLNKHDDAPDAASGLSIFIQGLYGHLY